MYVSLLLSCHHSFLTLPSLLLQFFSLCNSFSFIYWTFLFFSKSFAGVERRSKQVCVVVVRGQPAWPCPSFPLATPGRQASTGFARTNNIQCVRSFLERVGEVQLTFSGREDRLCAVSSVLDLAEPKHPRWSEFPRPIVNPKVGENRPIYRFKVVVLVAMCLGASRNRFCGSGRQLGLHSHGAARPHHH
jgi:hypothetical protein